MVGYPCSALGNSALPQTEPVSDERAYALDNNDKFGIWGGLSERERRRLRRSAA
jgi:hypothetical protein